jgi:hypothetical protein
MSFKAYYEGPGSKEGVDVNEFTERIPPEVALELYVTSSSSKSGLNRRVSIRLLAADYLEGVLDVFILDFFFSLTSTMQYNSFHIGYRYCNWGVYYITFVKRCTTAGSIQQTNKQTYHRYSQARWSRSSLLSANRQVVSYLFRGIGLPYFPSSHNMLGNHFYRPTIVVVVGLL